MAITTITTAISTAPPIMRIVVSIRVTILD
jgi:hypothetical protein